MRKSYRSRNKVSSGRGGREVISIASVDLWELAGWSDMGPTWWSMAVLHLARHFVLSRQGGSHWSLALLFPQTVNRSNKRYMKDKGEVVYACTPKVRSRKHWGPISRITCQTHLAETF